MLTTGYDHEGKNDGVLAFASFVLLRLKVWRGLRKFSQSRQIQEGGFHNRPLNPDSFLRTLRSLRSINPCLRSRGRDESRPYFVIFVLLSVIVFSVCANF